MKMNIKIVRNTLQKILRKRGMPARDASIVADEYLEGELQGKLSHGLAAFPSLMKRLTSGALKHTRVIKKTHAYIFVDAEEAPGILVGRTVADMLLKMAKKEGAGVGFIRNMTTWLRPGSIAQYIADRGCIAIVMNTGGQAMMAPPGGYEPMVGTNPIGIGIPANEGSLVVDMATSKHAWGAVRQAKTFGRKLPMESFFDTKGRLTRDPFQAYSVIATGDYKGFALGLLIEILGGSLVGMPMSCPKVYPKYPGEYTTSLRGACILVINPRFSTAISAFLSENTRLLQKIRKSKKRKGVKTILIPGDRARAVRRKNIARGHVDLSVDLWRRIESFLL